MTVTKDVAEVRLDDEVVPVSEPARPRERRWTAWLVGAGALLAGLCFVLVDIYYNHGRYVPPLDDAYIHMQYGAQIGRGEFLRYNDGDPISTGASSLLYVLLLGSFYAVGFNGPLLLPAAVIFGVVCHALTAAGVVVLGRRLAGPVVGAWSGALTAFSGPLLWGAASGMEISATALLLVSTLLVLTREVPHGVFRFTPVLVALAALARIEAMVFLVAVPVLMICSIWRRPGRKVAARIGATAWSALPFVVVAAQLLFYKIATGSASPNGSQAKSHLNMPNLTISELAGEVSDNFAAFMQILSGIERQDFTFPGALLLAAVGAAVLARDRGPRRWVGWTLGVGTVLALGAISTLGTALWQEVRYLQPFLPLFTLVAVIGLADLGGRLRAGSRGPVALLAVAALFTALSVPQWVHRTVQDSGGIRERVVALASWMNGALPPGTRVGVHDVGAAAYLSDHPTVDLVGLTTNGLAKPALNGMGALYEELREMPVDQRPEYVAIYDRMPEGVQLDQLADAQLFGVPVLALPTMTVYEADWSLIDTGDRPMSPVRGEIRDYVNVGSMASEEAHDHDVAPADASFQPLTAVRTVEEGGHQVVDSSRHVRGEEEFVLHDLVPGESVRLVARTDSSSPKPGMYTGARLVRVFADDTEVTTHYLEPDPKGWSETTITIPAELVTDSELTIRMGSAQGYGGPYPDYQSFGYWAIQ
ncbi:hypothetical protein GCM10009854_43090 [Saccharopolyspora halophila]|uniref:Glycosyltransferase RgtA/B/C/D-like domain-containing protein n=1 Tax=Saccharopolyspora halophila TaxID=405551 RepID=A0ABP5TR97_9PSEU